jgi:starvation-inducible outer membrane lipoprotein
VEVKNYDETKLFKITFLNLKGKTKEWYKKINPPPENWLKMKMKGTKIWHHRS